MRPQTIHEGRSLGFSSDLSLLAPIRLGLVPTLDSVSYATRARRLLQALHGGRVRAHEQAYARLLSDAVERVGVIQSVRVAVLEQEQKILLTVSFDGNWQSYIRVLWEKVGALLDVIFCNTQGYPQAGLNHYETWAAWVQEVQVETHFFYGSADGSAHDLLFLRRQQRRRIRGPVPAAQALGATLAPAEQRAVDVLRGRDLAVDEELWPGHARMTGALLEQGLGGLAGLYRLADLYLPGTDDGDTLLRAAHELLREFVHAWDNDLFKSAMAHPGANLGERFGRQVRWLLSHRPPERKARPHTDTLGPQDLADVQGGILRGYEHITHGALVLVGFEGAAAAGRFVQEMVPRLSTAAGSHNALEVPLFRNLALTTEGLRMLAVAGDDWDGLPEAFRQGMAARAGQLGDVQGNHPDRWCPPVELGAVHALVQLRARLPQVQGNEPWDATAQGLLADEVAALHRPGDGVHVLAAEPMRRQYRKQDRKQVIVEHFGYADGNGQPGVGNTSKTGDYPGNNLPFGDLLLGHDGSGDIDLAGVPAPPSPHWLRNSSFLALRRYRQHVDRFDAMLAEQSGRAGIDAEELAAKLMGRDRYGRSLVALHKKPDKPDERNHFTYRSDPEGMACPFHAHVRRANPRRPDRRPGAPQARIIRRSMSFGPARDEADAQAERGLYFMAYGANLAEQFETVQRWLAGGNSTGAASEPACPIVGVPRAGQKRGYGFVTQDGRAVEVEVDGGGPLTEDALPLTELQWGLYLLAPSLSTLRHLANQALAAAPAVPWTLERGRALLKSLQQSPAGLRREGAAANRQRWKAVLEDPDALDRWDSAALWAAVRADHGGALRTRHGILVAGHDLVMQVLQRPADHVTVDGYARAMRLSLGAIYLGLDDTGPGSRYRAEAEPVNSAISALGSTAVFDLARQVVQERLALLLLQSKTQAALSGALHFECTIDLRDLVDELLARLCEAWFGLSTVGGHFRRGPMDWHWKPGVSPSYPGHFMAPSRHIFQPWPEPVVVQRGRQHGRALRLALRKLLAPHLRAGTCTVDPATGRTAPVAQAILQHPLSQGDADFAARSMAGAVMGFVPTLDGALRTVAQEWQREETLWNLRARHAAQGGQPLDRARAHELIAPALFGAMAGRAVPDVVWRQAVQAFNLGGLGVQPGEKLVLGLGSAAHDAAQRGLPDARVMFGGDRSKSGHPTHACPGYDAAIEVMLGFWSVLVDRPEPWRPLQGSSVLRLDGPLPPPPTAPPPAAPYSRQAGGWLALGPPLIAPPRAASPLVMCWGDSWLDYRQSGIGRRIDLTVALEGLSQPYRVDRSFADFSDWGQVRLLAAGVQDFIDELRQVVLDQGPPAAILISGGGNDTTMPTLRGLLPAQPENVRPVFDETKVDGHIDRLMAHYTTLLTALQTAFADPHDPIPPVPVVLHGYDHPHPGRGISPWLWPAFRDLCSEAEAAQDMAWLIDKLNRGVEQLANATGPFGGFVHYVKLTGTLARAAAPDPAASLWENELHPDRKGFQELAQVLDRRIRQLPPAKP